MSTFWHLCPSVPPAVRNPFQPTLVTLRRERRRMNMRLAGSLQAENSPMKSGRIKPNQAQIILRCNHLIGINRGKLGRGRFFDILGWTAKAEGAADCLVSVSWYLMRLMYSGSFGSFSETFEPLDTRYTGGVGGARLGLGLAAGNPGRRSLHSLAPGWLPVAPLALKRVDLPDSGTLF
jgi:hypothetical protein